MKNKSIVRLKPIGEKDKSYQYELAESRGVYPNSRIWYKEYYDDVLGWCYMGKVEGDYLTVIGHAEKSSEAFDYASDKLNERKSILKKYFGID